jgi:hypothetical integral membrane protein (TIGR02206 family)
MLLQPFSFFGPSHLFVIIFTFIGLACIFFARKSSTRSQQILRYGIAGTLIFQIILFNGWHIYHSSFLIGSYLPFHLCSISAYLTIIALLRRNNFFSGLTYMVAFVSAFLAIVSPDVRPDQNFPEFRFIEFFLSHVFIIFGVWCLLVVDKITITYRQLWVSFSLLFGYMILVFPINKITGGNYLFLNSKPTSGGLFALFPPEPYHILVLVPLTLLIFHIQFGFYKLVNKAL